MKLWQVLLLFIVMILVGAIIRRTWTYNKAISKHEPVSKNPIRDASTTLTVKTELLLDPRVDSHEVDVDTKNGTVTITGEVPTKQHKKIIQDTTENIGSSEYTNNEVTVE